MRLWVIGSSLRVLDVEQILVLDKFPRLGDRLMLLIRMNIGDGTDETSEIPNVRAVAVTSIEDHFWRTIGSRLDIIEMNFISQSCLPKIC